MAKKFDRKEKPVTLRWLVARIVMIVVAGMLVLSYFSAIVNPAHFWLISVFGLLFVPFAVINFIFLVWAAARRSGTILIPLLALLPGLFFIGSYFQVPHKGAFAGQEDNIKIVSYNVGHFRNGDKRQKLSDSEKCMDSVFNFLRSCDADIICLQEFRYSDSRDLNHYIQTKMKGYNAAYYIYSGRPGKYGNVTISRFKPLNKGVIRFDGSRNLAIYTDYSANGKDFRVYNCHFESYNISPAGVVHSVLNQERDRIKDAEKKVRKGIVRRPRQVSEVFRHIEESPVKAMVCGDFNDSPMSYTYYKMSRGRGDSFREAGNGFGATYSMLWPFIRIDYVLYPKEFHAVSHATPKLKYSDHYPVVVELR